MSCGGRFERIHIWALPGTTSSAFRCYRPDAYLFPGTEPIKVVGFTKVSFPNCLRGPPCLSLASLLIQRSSRGQVFPSVIFRCVTSFPPAGLSIALGSNYFILPSSFPDPWAIEADALPGPPWRKQLLARPASHRALLTGGWWGQGAGGTGPWKQGGFWLHQEATLEKPGSLICPYLVPGFTACYWEGSGYQGVAGADPLGIHKE